MRTTSTQSIHSARSDREGSRGRVKNLVAGFALCALALGVTACSDDAPKASPEDRPRDAVTSSSTPHADGHGGESGHGSDVAVTAIDYGFQGLPDRIPAGTRLTLKNAAPAELHELVAFRLPDGEDRSVEQLVALPPDELRKLLGAAPPSTVLLAPPGADMIEAVGDGTLNEPGRYLIMCSIPTGVAPADYLAAAAKSAPAAPQVPGGPPHFMNGMVTDLIVE